MGASDRLGLPVTAASAAAAGNYVAAMDLLLSANAGANAAFRPRARRRPGFALAHAARARLLQLQARMADARDAAARARALAARATSWPILQASAVATPSASCSRTR
jgi:hypothetical protein